MLTPLRIVVCFPVKNDRVEGLGFDFGWEIMQWVTCCLLSLYVLAAGWFTAHVAVPWLLSTQAFNFDGSGH